MDESALHLSRIEVLVGLKLCCSPIMRRQVGADPPNVVALPALLVHLEHFGRLLGDEDDMCRIGSLSKSWDRSQSWLESAAAWLHEGTGDRVRELKAAVWCPGFLQSVEVATAIHVSLRQNKDVPAEALYRDVCSTRSRLLATWNHDESLSARATNRHVFLTTTGVRKQSV